MDKGIAVVGCGYWGKNLVRNFYALGVLHTVCDVDLGKSREYEQLYPRVKFTPSFVHVLSDKGIKGVVIATPAESHYLIAREALLAGKDVFVEKPLALTVEEGKDLVCLARERRQILMVGHILEYHPAILQLKELVDRGELGKINYVYSNRLNLGRFRTEENILWSFAPHDISVILFLLGEIPREVSAHGGNYLHQKVADVTVTTMSFESGVKSHIFVSWLHPYKEQKLIVVGDRKMVVFDDMAPKEKLLLYNHKIDWIQRVPVPKKENAEVVEFTMGEPLQYECQHFLECMATRQSPRTDGENGLRVLKILEAFQRSLEENGKPVTLSKEKPKGFFVHETSVVEEPCNIGEGTRIWHFSHVMAGAVIGKNCSIGQNVYIGKNTRTGNNVKIQNNVSVYEGVTLEDDVFCGPSMVFTNVINPRSHIPRRHEFRQTLVKKGATLGANSTILCGHTIGRYSFIGAGTVVTKDVPDYALIIGNPGKVAGWMCECGVKLNFLEDKAECQACSGKYIKGKDGIEKL